MFEHINTMKKLFLGILILILVVILGQAFVKLPLHLPCQIMPSFGNPFEKITENNGIFTVQFPSHGGRWMVIIESQGIERISEYGESFELKLKEKMELIEKHTRLSIEPIVEDEQIVLFVTKKTRTRQGDEEFLSCFMPVNTHDSKEAVENDFMIPSEEDIFTIATQPSSADLLNMALFGKTASQWRDTNSNQKGNIRDYANVSQLVCLANLETLNAHFIHEGIAASERLAQLNKIAINQMKILTTDNQIKQLDHKK